MDIIPALHHTKLRLNGGLIIVLSNLSPAEKILK